MRRIFLFWPVSLGLAVVLQGAAAPAAHAEEHGMMEEKFLERLGEKLDLSEAQKNKIKTIIEESQPEMKKLHEQMKAARRKTHEAIRETLTLDQKEKFDAMSVKMRAMHHGNDWSKMKKAPQGVMPAKKWVDPPKNEGVEPMKNEWIEPAKAEMEPDNGSHEE